MKEVEIYKVERKINGIWKEVKFTVIGSQVKLEGEIPKKDEEIRFLYNNK